ncbi:MAG: IS110 family transposase [Deltaproteobacteria bacterium]|nr:IS110 family transposase [Deltaproteobacteria bacterium]
MTHAQMIQIDNSTKNDRLYIAFDLSNAKWKLAFGNGIKKRQKTIPAGDLSGLMEEIAKAKHRFKMGDDVQIYSCYEAGRDGFWIHRFLESEGIHSVVVDSSSIEVNRRFRRAKSDRIDADKLLTMLIRYINGEQKLWSVLHIPTVEQEDVRRLDREIERLKKERTAHTNRIRSLLVLHGIQLGVGRFFLKRLEDVTQWNGEELPQQVKKEILREYERYGLIQNQLKDLESEKKEILASGSREAKKVFGLQNLKGIGPVSSWVLVYEYFGWRDFKNVKQVGGASGLTPTPYDSGGSEKEQGISKAGNRRVRSVMIEVAWYWVRYQPQSSLSRWFMERFGLGGKRMRKIGIVALARKLLVALWKYLEKGLVPEGAILKSLV